MEGILLLLIGWAALATLVLVYGRGRTFISLWREPVLKHPVVIVESDDWGPGENTDAEQLGRLMRLFAQFRDHRGRSPVLTLGIVLATPDTERMRAEPGQYHRRLLSDDRFKEILLTLREGANEGVFSLQLHGMEHYWPGALMAAAQTDETIGAWLTQHATPRTEVLPDSLQSRWTDASVLPSVPLPIGEINDAASAETEAFAAILERPARVVVPPTFVWDERVEKAWAAAGVRVVVTPGRRYEGRSREGAPDRPGPPIRNGDRGMSDLIYVVRDDYFEPRLDHRAERTVEAAASKTRAGRPTLIETHRFNFLGEPGAVTAAIAELERLLGLILQRFPDVLFLSTQELGEGIRQNVPDLIERNTMRRLHVWLVRLGQIPRVAKLAQLTGMIIPAWIFLFLTKPGHRQVADIRR